MLHLLLVDRLAKLEKTNTESCLEISIKKVAKLVKYDNL